MAKDTTLIAVIKPNIQKIVSLPVNCSRN